MKGVRGSGLGRDVKCAKGWSWTLEAVGHSRISGRGHSGGRTARKSRLKVLFFCRRVRSSLVLSCKTRLEIAEPLISMSGGKSAEEFSYRLSRFQMSRGAVGRLPRLPWSPIGGLSSGQLGEVLVAQSGARTGSRCLRPCGGWFREDFCVLIVFFVNVADQIQDST